MRRSVLSAFSIPELLTQKYTYNLQRTIPSVRRPFTPSSSLSNICRYGNINPLSIEYTFRLFLRSRLTLIRLALIRKPWSFGEQVSRLLYRYLCLHFLFYNLQQTSQFTFNGGRMLPYQFFNSIASAVCLMPAYYPRTVARLVSCYALFK